VPDVATAAGDAVRSFAADLSRALSRGSARPGNLVVSPYSVAVALAKTRRGARGRTGDEIDQVLHGGIGDLSIPGGGPNDAITLEVASALWGQRDLAWQPDFTTGLQLVDFAADPEAARGPINAWTREHTHGRIAELVPSGVLDVDTRLVLANAIYLKAPWATPFDTAATDQAPFTRADGSGVSVAMMSTGGATSMGWAEGPGWQAVNLAYAGGSLAMAVVVPDAGRLAEVEQGLDGAALGSVLSSFAPTAVVLQLPRWTHRNPLRLDEVLATLGMPTAFSNDADFSGMTTAAQLKIDALLHEAYIAVDEHGTEAAGATAGVMALLSAMRPQIELTVDRPFLFVLHDTATATPLFIGRVSDPSEP
jgi:serine protease inhibitor